MSKLSRRSLVASAAAIPAAAALPLPAAGSAIATEADPIFASIETHRRALHDANHDPLDENIDRLTDVEMEKMEELLEIVPTTLAGAIALLRYVSELELRHYPTVSGEVRWTFFVHENVAEAIARLTKG